MKNKFENKSYKYEPIPSEKFTKMFPEGTALVLEGGGMRGYYSAGVFEGFMDHGIMFPYIIGVSAGAANALSYITGQKIRSRQIVEKYAGSHKYVSKRNLIKYRSFFNRDFVFRKIPQDLVFFDYDALNNSPVRFLTGTMDCNTGEALWFEKSDLTRNLEVTEASCAIPIFSPIIKFNGYKLLDGGFVCPIPIEKSIEDGNKFHVIVLTQNKGYRKKPYNQLGLAKIIYRKYPKVVETLKKRHEIYNKQIELCEKLEKDGNAIIIRPQEPLKVNMATRDTKLLLELYDEGHKECNEIIERIMNNENIRN